MVKSFFQRLTKSFCLSFLCLGSFSFMPSEVARIHPFYISVVEINHNAADKTLEISCKIFTDDFEKTLAAKYKTSVDLINPKDRTAVEKYISDYIADHLSLNADNKPVKINYLGYEISEEAAWCYLQVDNIATIKNLDIVNKILYDYSDKQINIMHITVNGGRKSTKLDYPKTSASFSF